MSETPMHANVQPTTTATATTTANVQKTSAPQAKPQTSFATLGVPQPLVAALHKQGITEPFPIQLDTLPDTLQGRDVLGRGKTGSGKTLAFSIPMVARLGGKLAGGQRRSGRPLGLILSPTRELATQISAVIEPLASAYGLKVTTIFGGVSQQRQVAALKAGVDIVVACPGRLEDLMQQRYVSLDAVEITVLDEADHMADLGFLPVVTRIMDKTPNTGQRLLFSATLDNGIDRLVKKYLHNEVLHSVDEADSHVAAMTHHVFEVDSVEAKRALVTALASGTERRILFMRTKHHAKKLAQQLTAAGIPAADLHGNLSQVQRDRNLAAFTAGTSRVLVATDVAARGIDIGHVELVVHVDPPAEHKAYLHRSGRTARAGSTGDVVTVVLPTQRKDVAALLRKANITVIPEQVTASSDAVSALVGEVAAYVAPAPRAAGVAGGQSHGGRGGRSTSPSPSHGRSQGANARRKRALREGIAGAGVADASGGRPRRDRSGRPAAASGGSMSPTGKVSGRNQSFGSTPRSSADTARTGQSRRSSTASSTRSSQPSHAPRSQARSPRGGSYTSYSTSTPVRGERRTGRRAQG